MDIEEFRSCETFEDLVLMYTGRDMDYHRRHETTGLEFARLAWDIAINKQPIPCQQNGA